MTDTTDRSAAAEQAPGGPVQGRGERPRPAGPRLPVVPGPLETAAMAWRRLRKMSTALVLLFALSAAAILATFIPQEPVIPPTVAAWRAGTEGPGELWARGMDALGLFDVFGSWWFALLTVLLFTSLTGCLIPRWRAFARVVRRQPAAGRNLERLANRAVLATSLAPEAALAAAEQVLAHRRFRRRLVPGGQGDAAHLAAERGHWREGGSLLFHTSFYVLLVGVVIGHTFGFTGQVNVAEGSAFSDTQLAYDATTPGRFWELGDHRGFVVELEDFQATYFPDFTPADFVSTIRVTDRAGVERTHEVRVNHPVRVDGMKLYQARFGMAPHLRVRAGERVLYEGPVLLTAAGSFWTGREKVLLGDATGEAPQMALEMALVPDAAIEGGQVVVRSPEPRNPRLAISVYAGRDLGLTEPVPLSQLEWPSDALVAQAMLRPGGAEELLGGALTVEFVELAMWSGFQVSHAPGRGVLLLAGILVLAGLVPSLYAYRRRIWVRATPAAGGGSEVVVAGAALQRHARFAEEHAAIAAALRERLPAPAPATPGGADDDPTTSDEDAR